MNILLLTIATKNSQKMIRDIANELTQRGNQVFIVCPSDSENKARGKFLLIDGIRYLFVNSGNSVGKVSIVKKGFNFLSIDARFERAIGAAFPRNKIDLILYSTPPITLANTIGKLKKKTGACTYLMLKDIFPQNAVDMGIMKTFGPISIIWRYFRAKEKKLYRNSDYIGCMSPANCQYILNNNSEISKDKVGICVNSYREEPLIEINQETIRRKYNIPQEDVVFLYGGNLGKPQGLQYFVDVLEQNRDRPDRFFLICGGGNDQNRIINYIKQTQPSNIAYMPSIPPNEFDVLSRACDVGMVFLDRRFSIPNFPSRMLSIMLNEKPILAATDVNTDVNVMIADGNSGWWCESNDPFDMTRIIDDICANRDSINEKGRNARQYYLSHFTTKIACDQIETGVKKVRSELIK